MTTMKAIRIHSYGGPEVLVLEDAPMPSVGDQDALIRVHAASINPLDWKVRRGYLASMFNHTLPMILGWALSGVVEAVGPAVTSFVPGDAVFAQTELTRDGAYAEYIAVPASLLARKPGSLNHVEAAAIPLSAVAAWRCLITSANISSGQTVLIHGAAGGVGTFAVQLAKWRGAHVIGTASEGNLAFLRELGADEVVDYNVNRFEESVPEVDLVLDTIGGDTQQRSWNICKSGGMLVSIVDAPADEQAAARGVRQEFVAAYADAGVLTELGALVDSGTLRPIVSVTLPLAEVQQAHALSESLHTRGKIVLQVTS